MYKVRFESVKATAFMQDGDDQVYFAIDGQEDRVFLLENLPDDFFEKMSEEDKQKIWDEFKYDAYGFPG